MEEPLTEELLNELLNSDSPEQFLERNQTGTRVLADYLQELLDARNLERVDVVHAAHLNDTYGYELFTGKKKRPSRNIALQLAFAMGLSLRETDRLLQAAGASRLYCKNTRDAIIIFCLDRHATLEEVNEVLYARKEATLG